MESTKKASEQIKTVTIDQFKKKSKKKPAKKDLKDAKIGNVLGDYENFGWDTDMCQYKTIDDMWKTELGQKNISGVKNPTQGKDQWYKRARDYWKVRT
jgi:hypothetical protein